MTTSRPNEPSTRAAKALIRKRDFQGAAQVLQKLLDESPMDGDAIELLGTVYYYTRQLDLARETFKELTQTDPFRASGWINLGAVLNKLGDHAKAVEALRKGIQRDRQNPEAYYNMAMAQKAMKLNTMAVSAYKEAIKFKPDMVDAHLNLGILYSEMNNHSLAQQCYQNALRHDPNCKKAQSLLGETQSVQKNARNAVSPFGRLVNVDDLKNQQEDTGPRSLTVAQRNEERELVQAITKRIRPDAKALVPMLEGEIPDLLHKLEIITQQDANKFAGPDTRERLLNAIQQLKELRSSVAEGFCELREHLK